MRFQQKDKSLIQIAKEKPKDCFVKLFYHASKFYFLIQNNDKNVIPKQNQKTLIEFYNAPSYLGETRTDLLNGRYFYQSSLRKSVNNICYEDWKEKIGKTSKK